MLNCTNQIIDILYDKHDLEKSRFVQNNVAFWEVGYCKSEHLLEILNF